MSQNKVGDKASGITFTLIWLLKIMYDPKNSKILYVTTNDVEFDVSAS